MPIDFDGDGDYVDCGDIDAMDGQSALTIALWAYADTLGSYRALCRKQLDASNRIIMHVSVGGNTYWNICNGANTYGSKEGLVSTGAWHHFGLVFDGAGATNADRLKGYYDGVEQTLSYTGTIPATTPSTSAAFQIGYVNEWDGRIDDLAAWNAALTADEMESLASSRLRWLPQLIQPTNVIGYWPMDELRAGAAVPATAGFVCDLSGNGNHGTKAGDPYYAEGVLADPASVMYVPTAEVPPVVITMPIISEGGIHSPIFGGQVIQP